MILPNDGMKEPQAVREVAVQSEIGNLSHMADRLSDLTEKLIQRLNQVSMPYSEEKKGPVPSPVKNVPMANTLSEIGVMLANSVDRLEDQIKRLEI